MYGSSSLLQLSYDFQVDMRMAGVKVIHSSLVDHNMIYPEDNDLIFICSFNGRIFSLQKGKALEVILLSDHQKVVIAKDEVNRNLEKSEVLLLNTLNDTYEAHYIYLYYLDMIKTCYFEMYEWRDE